MGDISKAGVLRVENNRMVGSPVTETPGVKYQLDRLDVVVENLFDAISNLGGKIAPILTSPLPTPGEEASDARDIGGSSQIAALIEEQVHRVVRATELVQDLRHRVDV